MQNPSDRRRERNGMNKFSSNPIKQCKENPFGFVIAILLFSALAMWLF